MAPVNGLSKSKSAPKLGGSTGTLCEKVHTTRTIHQKSPRYGFGTASRFDDSRRDPRAVSPRKPLSARVAVPGPGAYETHERGQSPAQEPPKWGFGTGSRFENSKRHPKAVMPRDPASAKIAVPGPGAYETHDKGGKIPVVEAPKWGFGTGQRLDSSPKHPRAVSPREPASPKLVVPGPGAYDTHERGKPPVAEPPKWGFGTGSRFENDRRHPRAVTPKEPSSPRVAVPGPGAYETHLKGNTATQEPPQWGFGTATRLHERPHPRAVIPREPASPRMDTPGPGAYSGRYTTFDLEQ